MTTETPAAPPLLPNAFAVSPPNVPFVYGDVVSHIALGVHVSRLVFSLEQGANLPAAPQLTVAIPTESLLTFAVSLLEQLNGNAPELIGRHERFSKLLKTFSETLAPAISSFPEKLGPFNVAGLAVKA